MTRIFWRYLLTVLNVAVFLNIYGSTTEQPLTYFRLLKRSLFRPRFSGCRLPPSGYPSDPLVFLSVSALASVTNGTEIQERFIELNWKTANPNPTDWIGLFPEDKNPTDLLNTTQSIAYVENLANKKQGNLTTHVQFVRKNFTISDLNSTACIGPWIAYVRNGKAIATNCLKSHPSWMWEDKDTIGDVPIRMLMIPGTHDSGSYEKYRGQASENIVNRYVMCHDEDFWNQLIYGIRHLDLRVAYYPDTPEVFWLNHDAFKVNALNPAIQDIKRFVNNTKEVVILDFHRFPIGFHTEVGIHVRLINYLIQELGEFMIPRDSGIDLTINQAIEMNKRLIVTYSNTIYNISNLLWPGINQAWGDTTQLNVLKRFLDNEASKPHDYFWAGMAELTPSALDIITNPKGGNRRNADKSNRNVTQWYRELWWDRVNIVAVDYFHATDIVDLSREANRQRKHCFDRMRTRNRQFTTGL